MTKSKNIRVNWSEGEAKTQKEIDERIAKKMLNPNFLEALMQESPFMKEHVKVIPIPMDVTQHERIIKKDIKKYFKNFTRIGLEELSFQPHQ